MNFSDSVVYSVDKNEDFPIPNIGLAPGKLKQEFPNCQITEFYALTVKAYNISFKNNITN